MVKLSLSQMLAAKLLGRAFPWTPPDYGDPAEPELVPSPAPRVVSTQAEKLRALARSARQQGQAKLDPAIGRQRLTARRASIAASMARDGMHLLDVAKVLDKLADLWELNLVPPMLQQVRTKVAVKRVLSEHTPLSQVIPYGILSVAQQRLARVLCQDWTREAHDPELAKKAKIAELERELIGCKIPGFFPTPPSVIRQMIEWAAIESGMDCLEPSAGKGDICDAMQAAGGRVFWFEVNHQLQEIILAKGHGRQHGDDFLECDPAPIYNRILMNPPFEHGQDAEHVMRAFEWLKPGGVLVAITGEGIWFREDAKAISWRAWWGGLLFANRATVAECEQLPEGAFSGTDSFRQTGVRCRILKIRKRG